MSELEQPGNTKTYAARVAGANVLDAVKCLTLWAQIEVLAWALAQKAQEVHSGGYIKRGKEVA